MIKPILILAAILFVSACTPAAKIETNKAANFTSSIHSIEIIENMGDDGYLEDFNSKLSQMLIECGVAGTLLDGVASDEFVKKNFSAANKDRKFETILSISLTGFKANRSQGKIGNNYELTLWDSTATKIWKSTIEYDFNGMSLMQAMKNNGYELARLVVGAMRKDGLLQSCPAVAP